MVIGTRNALPSFSDLCAPKVNPIDEAEDFLKGLETKF